MRYVAPKGTHDVLPAGPKRTAWEDDIDKWHWLEDTFRDLCRRYAYDEIRTPIFEAAALVHRSVGEGTDIVSKETYDFTTKGGDALTLRPEGTAGLVRAYVQHRLDLERPVTKLFYIGPNFRYERPQKGRYHQHTQFGIEMIGASGPEADAEIIGLLHGFFAALGLTRLTVKLNSVGNAESRARFVAALRDWAAPLLTQMSEENQRRFAQNALRMLDSKNVGDQALLDAAPKITDFLDDDSRTHFETLQAYLQELGIAFELDAKLVRGFDYYTRTLFEITSPDVGSQSALAGGGRYNDLVAALGGPSAPGIGFGIGVERTLIALQTAGVVAPDAPALDAFVCPLGAAASARAVSLVAALRQAGLSADRDYTGRKLSAQFALADARRARFALILGDDEIANGVVQVRDMQTKAQTAVPLADIATSIRHSHEEP